MVIMATKVKRMSVYKTMMRRRAFTKWSNLLLQSTQKQIVDIFNVNERDLLEDLLTIVLKESKKKFQDHTEETRITEKGKFLAKAELFRKNYLRENQSQVVNRVVVAQFIWDLVEYFHISPGKWLWENEQSKMNAKDVLLTWLNSKLVGRQVKNFTTDWNDGTLLCDLINALEPDVIPPKVYLQGSWPHRNVTLAMETAEKEWGIPDIISPNDMITSEVDELSVMTYVSLFFEFDLQRFSTNHNARVKCGEKDVKTNPRGFHEKDLRKENGPCNDDVREKTQTADQGYFTNGKVPESRARSKTGKNGNGEKKGESGKVGKAVEYILNLHDIKANEITVSVEYKSLGKLKQEYKPDLKVASLGKGKFRVKYTPNVSGNYTLNLFYQGEHIGDSPYYLKVPQLNGTRERDQIDTNNAGSHCSGITGQVGTDVGFYGYDGEGLKRATVGKLAVFTVITDNRDKGPLSVCINCPAVSIPVPHVKTTHSLNYSTHTIAYLPTLAGTYNIYVRWGLKLINGAPFRVQITDHDIFKPKPLVIKGSEGLEKKRQSTEFSHIKIYYSASSLHLDVIRDTADLEELLARYGLTKASCDDMWVSVDVELEKDERELIFRLAGTRKLPLVFIHENCLGTYSHAYNLHQLNELEKNLLYKVRKV